MLLLDRRYFDFGKQSLVGKGERIVECLSFNRKGLHIQAGQIEVRTVRELNVRYVYHTFQVGQLFTQTEGVTDPECICTSVKNLKHVFIHARDQVLQIELLGASYRKRQAFCSDCDLRIEILHIILLVHARRET